jgi:hypothetical protein
MTLTINWKHISDHRHSACGAAPVRSRLCVLVACWSRRLSSTIKIAVVLRSSYRRKKEGTHIIDAAVEFSLSTQGLYSQDKSREGPSDSVLLKSSHLWRVVSVDSTFSNKTTTWKTMMHIHTGFGWPGTIMTGVGPTSHNYDRMSHEVGLTHRRQFKTIGSCQTSQAQDGGERNGASHGGARKERNEQKCRPLSMSHNFKLR